MRDRGHGGTRLMPLTQTAVKNRVYLQDRAGDNQLEVTDLLLEVGIKNSRLDQSGLIKATGTLTLSGIPTIGWTEDLDIRSNFARFAPGSRVIIETRKSNGSYVANPRGALRILRAPSPPRGLRDLEIQVGCDLAYLDNDETPENNTGLIDSSELATGITILTALNRLGTQIGAPTVSGSMPSTPTIHGFPNRNQGTKIKLMGGSAYAYAYALWVDGSRTIRPAQINLTATPLGTYTAGVDGEFDAEIGDFPPPDDLVVAGNRIVKLTRSSDDIDDDNETGTVTNNATLTDPWGNPSITTSSTEQEDIVFPENPDATSSQITVSTDTSTETWSGKVFSNQVQLHRTCKGLLIPDLAQFDTDLTDAKETTETHLHDTQGVTEISTVTREPIGLFDPEASAPWDLVISAKVILRWKQQGTGWIEQRYEFDKRQGLSKTSYRSGPNYGPPSPRTKNEETEAVEEPEVGEAGVEAVPPRRKSVIKLIYPTFGSGQIQTLAELNRALEWGAALPATWEMPLWDGFLDSYNPLWIFDWVDQGRVYRYLSQSHAFSFTRDAATVAMEGLFLGEVVDDTLIPPFEVLS